MNDSDESSHHRPRHMSDSGMVHRLMAGSGMVHRKDTSTIGTIHRHHHIDDSGMIRHHVNDY
nr:hypothetical protein [uncultured Desulfobacter sp.]